MIAPHTSDPNSTWSFYPVSIQTHCFALPPPLIWQCDLHFLYHLIFPEKHCCFWHLFPSRLPVRTLRERQSLQEIQNSSVNLLSCHLSETSPPLPGALLTLHGVQTFFCWALQSPLTLPFLPPFKSLYLFIMHLITSHCTHCAYSSRAIISVVSKAWYFRKLLLCPKTERLNFRV